MCALKKGVRVGADWEEHESEGPSAAGEGRHQLFSLGMWKLEWGRIQKRYKTWEGFWVRFFYLMYVIEALTHKASANGFANSGPMRFLSRLSCNGVVQGGCRQLISATHMIPEPTSQHLPNLAYLRYRGTVTHCQYNST